MNNLSKARPVRLTDDQDRALIVLKSKGFNRSKFIRLAIEEKLYRDYRKILAEIKRKEQEVYCPF